MKPVYQDQLVTLYHGDFRTVAASIADRSVTMIWADPPYGHNNNNGDLSHRREVALGKTKKIKRSRPIKADGPVAMRREVSAMFEHCARIMDPICCCCCCCCGGGGPKPTFAWVANRADEKPWSFFHAVVWDKGGLGLGWRYRRNYELVMISHLASGKLAWHSESRGMVTANVVKIPKRIPTKAEHPTPKPVALIEHFIRLHTKPGDLIFDPFCGAGPSLVAARNLGRRIIGCDIDARWIKMAVSRLSQPPCNPLSEHGNP